MPWRIYLDESTHTNAQIIAWEIILPYKHIPIIEKDYFEVAELSKKLEKFFSKQALASTAKRIKNNNKY